MTSNMRSCARIPVALFIAVLAVAAPAAAQDKAKAPAAAPEKAKAPAGNQKAILENDKVKVFEVRYKPGDGSAARERPGRVVHALTDGTMLRTYPDGKTQKMEWKAGDTKWLPKESFGNKNVGKNDVVLLVIETK